MSMPATQQKCCVGCAMAQNILISFEVKNAKHEFQPLPFFCMNYFSSAKTRKMVGLPCVVHSIRYEVGFCYSIVFY